MLKRIFLFSLAFFVTIVALDFYLQSAGIQSLALGIYDDQKGYRLVPHKKYTFFKEGYSISEISNLGYYGKDSQLNKLQDTFRIALLGDSYVEGFQVFDRDHFRSILEKRLATLCNCKVEVMNFGMSGFDLTDDYCYYSQFVKQFNPDLVVIILRQSDLEAPKKSALKPYCFIENDLLKIDESYLQSDLYRYKVKTQITRGKSAVGDIFSKCKKLVQHGQCKSVLLGKFAKTPSKLQEVSGKDEFRMPDINIKIFEELLKENVIIAYFDTMGTSSLSILESFSDHLVDLNIPLNLLRDQQINPNYWKATNREGHWNHEAHRAVGGYLAATIETMMAGGLLQE